MLGVRQAHVEEVVLASERGPVHHRLADCDEQPDENEYRPPKQLGKALGHPIERVDIEQAEW
jgi:hypothetical protein